MNEQKALDNFMNAPDCALLAVSHIAPGPVYHFVESSEMVNRSVESLALALNHKAALNKIRRLRKKAKRLTARAIMVWRDKHLLLRSSKQSSAAEQAQGN